MRIKLRNLFNNEASSVFSGMLTLLLGSSISRILGIICIPILTRIYSPEDYGLLALYTSIVSILSPILTLRYSQAIPLPKNDAIAFNLFVLCLSFIFSGGLLLFVILCFFSDDILPWFSMADLSPYWWLIAFGVIGSSLYELLTLWATRKKQYKLISRSQVVQSLIGNLAKVGLGLLALKPIGLIFGQFLTQSSGVFSIIKSIYSESENFKGKITKKRIDFIAKYYQEFAWFRLPSQFLMVLSVQAPIIIMANLFGKESTGQLSLAIMALSLPISLIGQAIAKAYYAEIASVGRKNKSKIKSVTIDIQKKLFLIGIPITIIIFFFSELLFKIVFGSEWIVAGKYAALLSPYILMQFTSGPLIQVLNVIGSQLHYLIINIFRIVGLLFLYLIFKKINSDAETLVFSISVYLFLFYGFITLFILKLVCQDIE